MTEQKGLQLFGGDWTEIKLDVLGKYLAAYTTALKRTRFKKLYIDAFAGTGYREQRLNVDESEAFLFEDGLDENESQQFLEGSAQVALRVDPPFDGYIFVESKAKRVDELDKLRTFYPTRSDRIEIRHKEANEEIQRICSTWDRRRNRAVLFLDPFGLQVDWSTVQAVGATECFDTWILFPFSVNRLLTRSPESIPPKWCDRLDRLFGTHSWFEEFYQRTPSGFFDERNDVKLEKRRINLKGLGAFYHKRLQSVFTSVAPTPCILSNSRHAPLFQLMFAAGDKKGAPIAMRIAEHIIRGI